MAYNWIGERVSVTDFERVLKNVILELDDVSWGPNNTFRFPRNGGTGEIFRRLVVDVAGLSRCTAFKNCLGISDRKCNQRRKQ
jgi:hypothetical protein